MDRLLVCAVYWIVANRYHTGQASRGYAKLSQLACMGYNPGLAGWANERGSGEQAAAARLLAARGAAKSDCSGRAGHKLAKRRTFTIGTVPVTWPYWHRTLRVPHDWEQHRACTRGNRRDRTEHRNF
jgi:hypothetical protein